MNYKIWLRFATTLLISVFLTISPDVKAASGDLDLTFGSGGKVVSDTGFDDETSSMALEPDGGIVVSINKRLVRHSPDGLLEQVFGNTGDSYTGVAVQPDGKIVTVGNYTRGSLGCMVYRVNVRRFNADGTPDTSFGVNGGWTSYSAGCDESGYRAYGYDVALQTDGKIVVAGQVYTGNYPNNSKLLALRLNSNGTFDTGFNGDGIGIYTLGNVSDKAFAVAVNPATGRIVLAGHRGVNGSRNAALLMLTSAGNVYISFGNFGAVYYGTDTDFFAVAFQADNKVLAGGGSNGGWGFLARYNTDGTLDPTFDDDGVISWNVGFYNDAVTDIAVQPDGKIVAASYSDFFNDSPDTKIDFVAYRFNPNGSYDTTFSDDGKLSTDFGKSEYCASLAIQPDGRIILAGRTYDFEITNIALARYLP